MVVHDVDVMELLPPDLAQIEVADAVGGEVGDFDLDHVRSVFQEIGDVEAEWVGDDHAGRFAIDAEARAFADVSEVE